MKVTSHPGAGIYAGGDHNLVMMLCQFSLKNDGNPFKTEIYRANLCYYSKQLH